MRRVVLVAFLLALASAYGASGFAAASQAPLHATQGYVRVSLPQIELAGGISLRLAGAGKPVSLVRDPALGAHAFGAWVPAGEYQIDGMAALNGGQYLPVPVQAGRLTDLGAIIQIQLGGYETALLAIAHPEAAVELHYALKQMADAVTGEAIEWRPRDAPKTNQVASPNTGLGLVVDLLSAYERRVNKPALSKQLKSATTIEEMYRLAKLAVAPATEQSAADDLGTLFYGADLGQLRARTATGEWRSVDTGTLETITAIATDAKQLIAGTSGGSIRVSDDSGLSWRHVGQLAANEAVIDIDRVGDLWLVLAATIARNERIPQLRSANEIKVYTAQRDLKELSFLRLVTTAKTAPLRVLGLSDPFAGIVAGKDYYVNALAEILKLDTASMQWSALKPPQKVSSFQVSGDPGVITALYAQGAFSRVSASFDGGASWSPFNRPPYAIYDVRLTDAEHGTASRWNSGMFSATLEFLTYDASKKTWTRTYDAPPGCRMMLRDADFSQRFCLTSGGSILVHKDDQWQAEFAVE